MAESILSDMAVGLISKLGSSVLNEIGLWWGLKDELQDLKATVSTIEAVLLDAEEKSMVNHQVKHWLGMLSEAMYDADDLLDDFSTEALRQQAMGGSKTAKKVRVFFSCSNQFAFGPKMAHKVKAMKERLDKIAAKRMFHLEERSMKKVSVATGWRQTHSSPPQVVIGREADKEAILKSLLSSDYPESVSVVAIVGIGGLGKTTLAQLVYNDAIVQKHFELKMWVCVSQNFDLQLLVKKEINGKKYLLVLDDVWNENANVWLKLKDVLAGGAKGSKILLTTRLRNIAKMSKPIYIHELRGLSEDEAWSLFKQMAFEMGQVPNSSYEAIGKEIVAKCCGVPLAIRAIGGMMYSKDLEEWLLFKDEELSKIDVYKTDIFPILELSYNHLPSNYKNCFAYCSLYPEDHRIHVEELIQFWKAQGYLKATDSNKCLQDVGLQCFTTLLRLSFFQDEEEDNFGNTAFCKMHDLMHNLAVSVAGDNFSASNSGITRINERTKHISFDRNSGSQVIFSSLKAKRLRTILRIDRYEVLNTIDEELEGVFCKFRSLRVLNLPRFDFVTVPSSIYKLKHLRHLDLSVNRHIKKLPDSITNLWNLQVLILNWCRRLEQLPDNITKLVNLTDLDNDRCEELTHMPRGIGKLTRLEKLSLFVIGKDSCISKHSGGLDELHALNKLKGSLEIVNLECVKNGAVDFEAANLKGKQLQILKLNWNEGDDRNDNCSENDENGLEALRPHQSLKELKIKGYRGERPPSWLPLLTNLVSIEFWSCGSIEWLPPLDQLPYLRKLILFHLRKVERIEVVGNYENRVSSSSFFPSLTHLDLRVCRNLKGFVRGGKSDDVGMKPSSSILMEDLPCFPCLSRLKILGCRNLTSMPLFPELKTLEISGDYEIKSVMEVLKRATTSASESTSSPFSTLSQLEVLSIYEMEDCEVDELLPYLPSLQSLQFKDCKCKSVSSDEKDDGMHWQSLKVLQSVEFRNMQYLDSLPKGLQYVTTLQRLDISYCRSLASIPEWMGNLISLQDLNIKDCPQLTERCKNNTAENWPQISHIPNIKVDIKYIQRNGRIWIMPRQSRSENPIQNNSCYLNSCYLI